MTDLCVRHIRGTNKWILLEPLGFNSIVVPAGFVTNFANIPRFLKPLVDDDDPRILEAAVVHDYLYVNSVFPREKCDDILRDGIIALCGDKALAKLVHDAVRLGGHERYGKPIE